MLLSQGIDSNLMSSNSKTSVAPVHKNTINLPFQKSSLETENAVFVWTGGLFVFHNSHLQIGVRERLHECALQFQTKNSNSYFSLDLKTIITKHQATKVLSLDFKKEPDYFNWNFPV